MKVLLPSKKKRRIQQLSLCFWLVKSLHPQPPPPPKKKGTKKVKATKQVKRIRGCLTCSFVWTGICNIYSCTWLLSDGYCSIKDPLLSRLYLGWPILQCRSSTFHVVHIFDPFRSQRPEEVLLELEPSFWSGGHFLLQDHSLFLSEFFPSPIGGVVGYHNFRHNTQRYNLMRFICICAGTLGCIELIIH